MRKKLWIFFLILGTIPFIIPLVYGIYSFFAGFSFFTTTKGFEGMFDAIIVWSFVYWPTYIIGLILIIVSIIKLKKKKKK